MSGQTAPAPEIPSIQDREAAALLQENDDSRLVTVQDRAEKWTAGLTALTGLIATVFVVEGPADAADLPAQDRLGVAILVVTALGLLIAATCQAYSAAHGAPGKLISDIDRTELPGLYRRLNAARRRAARQVETRVRNALVLTIMGITAVLAAALLTWFPSASAEGSDPATCVLVGDQLVAEFPGDEVTVTEVGAGVVIQPCD